MSKKYIYVNLKRFDVPTEMGGVNSLAQGVTWAKDIIEKISPNLKSYSKDEVEFSIFFPEAHVIGAVEANMTHKALQVGCQGVYRDDVEKGKNFGAFTTNRTAKSMKALGVETAIIGHCEERNDKKGLLALAGVEDFACVHEVLNKEVLSAQSAGLNALFCIGETSEEQENWEEVLREQLRIGLNGSDRDKVVIAYEPVWAIGPGKTPPGKEYIEKIASFIKKETKGLPVVYGGGLKEENAQMLSTVENIDGGLIALTRFSGDIGFYPEEFLEIVKLYIN